VSPAPKEDEKSSPSGRVAYFDFDDTLIPGDSILYWKRFLFRKKPFRRYFQFLSWLGVLAFLLRLRGPETLKRIFLLPTSYLAPDERESMAREFVREELIPKLYPEILEKLREHQDNGLRVVIISASPDFYLNHLEEHLPGTRVIGTSIEFPVKGLLRLPKFDSEWGNMKGETKVQFLRRDTLEPNTGKDCIAYSDNHSDAPLLQYAEHAVAVQPNRKLELLAKEKGWSIIRPFIRQSRWQRNLSKAWLLLTCLGS
jgi:HAD superfamily hydrolase (TIGR01490 family)